MPKRKSSFFSFWLCCASAKPKYIPVKKEKKKRSRQIQIGIFFQKVATKLFSVFHTGHLFVIFDIHFYPWGGADYQSSFSFWLPRKLIKILFGWEPGQKGATRASSPFFFLDWAIGYCSVEKSCELPVRCFGAAAAAVATWWGQWRRGAEIWSGCVSDNGSHQQS